MKKMNNSLIAILVTLSVGQLHAQHIKSEVTLSERYSAVRLANGYYQLSLPSGNYRIFEGNSPQGINYDQPILEAVGNVIISAKADERKFFSIVAGPGDTVVVSERLIALKGPSNFRDLGGIRTTTGKYTKWGAFYRSDELASIPDADFPYFERTGIKNVYDLRSQHEVNEKPDNLPASTKWTHFPIFEESGDSEEIKAMMQKVMSGDLTTAEAGSLLADVNYKFVADRLDRFKALIPLLMDGDDAVLFHCTAGKDRTGFTAALILAILGVDRETILQEYTMTNYYTIDKVQRTLTQGALSNYAQGNSGLLSLMTVDRKYLEAAFDEIDKQYGGIDNFIRDGLGVSDEKRKIYMERYTF